MDHPEVHSENTMNKKMAIGVVAKEKTKLPLESLTFVNSHILYKDVKTKKNHRFRGGNRGTSPFVEGLKGLLQSLTEMGLQMHSTRLR